MLRPCELTHLIMAVPCLSLCPFDHEHPQLRKAVNSAQNTTILSVVTATRRGDSSTSGSTVIGGVLKRGNGPDSLLHRVGQPICVTSGHGVALPVGCGRVRPIDCPAGTAEFAAEYH